MLPNLYSGALSCWLDSFSTAWLPHCFLFPIELGVIDRRACWGCLWDTVSGTQAWSLGNDCSLWIFCLCKINCCLLPTNQNWGFALREVLDLKEQISLLYTQGKDHLKSLIPWLLWLQCSRATQFVAQIPILVQENHLPCSFLLPKLLHAPAAPCTQRHAHMFSSLAEAAYSHHLPGLLDF